MQETFREHVLKNASRKIPHSFLFVPVWLQFIVKNHAITNQDRFPFNHGFKPDLEVSSQIFVDESFLQPS